MEGFMLVPPERGGIISRAVWKPRYVVLGGATRLTTPPENAIQRSTSKGIIANARKGLKASTSKPSLADMLEISPAGGMYLTIYKAKDDWEFISQHAVASFDSCDIQTLNYRKQNPMAPTLMINLKPDLELEKQRKRRSSRTGGLTSSKDPWANTLLFRTVPEERYNINDWQMALKSFREAFNIKEDVLSPISPAFSSFSNPFTSRDPRPLSSSQRPDLSRGFSNQTMTSNYSSVHKMEPRNERPSAMISPSPSLRSRRSDLSSQASSQPPLGFTSTHQHYSATLPSDLPSPASLSGYDNQFIEGWTSAQGRSSALSSHTRGSNSIASAVAPIGSLASSPPGPRETILDRAFKNRVIPGSDRLQESNEDKLSSLARFEALMQEIDEKKERRSSTSKIDAHNAQDWGLDDSDDSDYEDAAEEGEDLDLENDETIDIPTSAQRALEYISGRRTPIRPSSSHARPLSPVSRSPPIPFLNQQAMAAFHAPTGTAGGLRPRTGTTSRPTSFAIPPRAMSIAAIPTLKDLSLSIPIGDSENRSSSASGKRLSFSEFTKRLSSTSSLLLVQTNASSSQTSKRGSSEVSSGENEETGPTRQRTSVSLRGGSGVNGAEHREKRCGWRGSIGVFGGNEGGFL